jgi:hypothetical protein
VRIPVIDTYLEVRADSANSEVAVFTLRDFFLSKDETSGRRTVVRLLGGRYRDPLPRKFFCVVSVRPRFMPKEFSKLSDVLLGCCGASLDISLVHDPKVIRKPARCARLPQLLFKSVEVDVPWRDPSRTIRSIL